jgi:DNA-binding NarL/FixJ family response regulator
MNATGVAAGAKHRILIADDQPLFRDGVRSWLHREPDLVCCGETATEAATREAVERENPDLVLLELRLQGEDAFELIRALRAAHPKLCILVVSQYDEKVFGHRALRAGVRGYIMKDHGGAALIQAIRTVLAGEVHVSKPLAATMIRKLWHGDTSGDQTARLSDRELQVFRLLGSGLGTKQVAQRLRLSVKTVETYREHIKQKLELRDAPTLVHAATTWVQNRSASLGQPQAPDQA